MSRTRFIILLVCVIGLVSMGISLLGTEVVKQTGDENFCGSCHEMQPMVKTYQQDIHGGNNPHGFTTECVGCHLPHTNIFDYLVSKGMQGTNDIVKVLFTDTSKIDWISRRKQREEFVFDSGCLTCHNKLLDKTVADNPKSLEMHQHYKDMQQSEKPINCVSCHVTVGHNGELRSELNQLQPEYKFSQDLIKNKK